MSGLFSVLLGSVILVYPFAVYFSLHVIEPWTIAAILLVALVARLLLPRNKAWNIRLIGVGIVYCCFAIWQNNTLSLRFYPVIINATLLTVFYLSLFSSQSVIEQLARLQHPNLPPEGVQYTRKVTQVWCVFFIFNGLIATATALWSSFMWWSLYNGVIAYILMGILMAIEYYVRIRTQPHAR